MNDGITGMGASSVNLADPRMNKLFSKLDQNGDGKVDKSELEKVLSARGMSSDQIDSVFSKLDTDQNGSIDQSEFQTAFSKFHHHLKGLLSAARKGGDNDGDQDGSETLGDLLKSLETDASTSDTEKQKAIAGLKQLLAQLQGSNGSYTESGEMNSGGIQSVLSQLA